MEAAWSLINDPKRRPVVMFLDLAMPKSEGQKPETEMGFELLKRVKDDKNLKNIKVIIFSGFSDLKYKTKARELGAEEYLVKDENLPQDLVEYMTKLAKQFKS
jgi:CheY-like chemotaxis protein